MMRGVIIALVAITAMGCGRNCPGLEGPAFIITIVDSATQTDLCDAVVVAANENGTFDLTESGVSDASCSYGGLNGVLPTGTYTLTVSAPGHVTTSVSNVTVSRDDCNLEQPTIRTIALAMN